MSFVGGGQTPVEIYNSDGSGGFFNQNNVGGQSGTSLSAPCWAGLVAIADQGLALQGLPPINTTATTLQTDLYNLPSADFHDITSGNNGFAAGPGYDLVTGIGTPVANLLIPDLVGSPAVLAYSTPDNFVGANIVVKQVGANIDVFNNGNLVTTHPLSTTSQIDINGDDTKGTITCTVDYSGGEFTIPVNFNGGTGNGPHTLNIDNGSFSNETYSLANSSAFPGYTQSGNITLDGSTINYLNVPTINDNPSGAADTIQVDQLSGDDALTINNPAGGQDNVYVGGGPSTLLPSLGNVEGTVTFNGLFGGNLYLEDAAGPSNATYQLSEFGLSRPGAGTIDFNYVNNVTLDVSPGNDTVNVNGLNSIAWPNLDLVGAAFGTISLQVDASVATNYTVAAGQMTIGPSARDAETITYSALTKLELDIAATASPNNVDVENTPASTVINDRATRATVTVCQTSMNLDTIDDPLTVEGSGHVMLTVDDQNNPNLILTTDTIASNSITRDGIDGMGRPHNASISYSGLASLTVNTGVQANLVFVESTAVSTTVNAGAGNLLFDITDQTENLDNLHGGLTVTGNGADPLIVNDQKNPNPTTTTDTVTGVTVRRTAKDKMGNPDSASITYRGLGSLELNTGNLVSAIDVKGTTAPTTLNTGANNVISVGQQDEDLANLLAPLTITGTGSDLVTLSDQRDFILDAQYTVTSSSLTLTGITFPPGGPPEFGNASINYSGVSRLALNGSLIAPATYDVQSTNAATSYTVNGGGAATFNVGSSANTLDAIQGLLTIVSSKGPYTVNFDDQGETDFESYTLNGSTLQRSGMANITYTTGPADNVSVVLNMGSAEASKMDVEGTYGNGTVTTINGGNSDEFNVLAVASGASLILQGGLGENTMCAGSSALALGDTHPHHGTLANIAGTVSFTLSLSAGLQGATNDIVLDDTADKASYPSVALGASTLQNLGPGLFEFSGSVNSFSLYGGSGNNVYDVNALFAGASPEVLSAGTGSDTVNLAVVDDYQDYTTTTVHGQNNTVLNINDQTVPDPSTYAVTPTSVTRTTTVLGNVTRTMPIDYDGMTSLTVNGGSGGDTFTVSGTLAATPTTLNGGAGANTFNINGTQTRTKPP